MAKNEKVRKVKGKKELPPYEFMNHLDSNSMFASVFYPSFRRKHEINNNALNKSKSVMLQGEDKCSDPVWGQFISQYWIEKYGLDNLQAMKSLYNSGLLSYDGSEEDFNRQINYFENKFNKFNQNTKNILRYDIVKDEVLPYFTKYSDAVIVAINNEAANDSIDVLALADFHGYLDMTIKNINEYLNYVETTPKEQYNEYKLNKLMTIAISTINLTQQKIKEFEFELKKIEVTLSKVIDQEKQEKILQSCKYMRLKPHLYYIFASSIVTDLNIALPDKIDVHESILKCAQCKKEDYTEYVDFMMKTKSLNFEQSKYKDVQTSQNWLVSDVANELANNQTFNNVIKNGKFESIDNLLEIAGVVFNGVKQAIDNSPLKDFVNLSFMVDTSNKSDNKAIIAFALTQMTDNRQRIVLFKEPLEKKLSECNDINILIFTIVTMMHESLHALECAIRGTKEFQSEATTNSHYKFLEEKGFVSNNELTQEDYFLLACLSPSLLESINTDSKKYNVSIDTVLKIMSGLASGVFDRDMQTEINAHRFSSVSTQAILKSLSNIYAEKGDFDQADKFNHHAEYDVYAQAYQLHPEHLEDREKLDNIMNNLIKDLSEVNSVDRIEYMLSNHVITARNSEEAKELEERSKNIFRAYYLNLSEENRELLKQECISSLKFNVLNKIGMIKKQEATKNILNINARNPENSINDKKSKNQCQESKYLTFTPDEIIQVYENSKKYGISADSFVKIHYEHNEQAFKEVFLLYCNNNEVDSVASLMPFSVDVKQEDMRFFIDNSVNLLFKIPEKERNRIEVNFFISDIIGMIESYAIMNKENTCNYTEVLEQLNNEKRRIEKYIDDDFKNPNKNNFSARQLSLPQTSSADNSVKQ